MGPPAQGVPPDHLVLVELVVPIVDDQGLVEGTLLAVLAEAGLHLRPGGADALAGAAAAHAVATLLGGHGHDTESMDADALVRAVEQRWLAAAHRGEFRLAAGAGPAIARLLARGPVGVLSNLPEDAVSHLLAEHAPGADHAQASRGLPHPDAILSAASRADVAPTAITVVAHSPAVLLAAAQAGVESIVLVGERHGQWAELVPVHRRVATLSAL